MRKWILQCIPEELFLSDRVDEPAKSLYQAGWLALECGNDIVVDTGMYR